MYVQYNQSFTFLPFLVEQTSDNLVKCIINQSYQTLYGGRCYISITLTFPHFHRHIRVCYVLVICFHLVISFYNVGLTQLPFELYNSPYLVPILMSMMKGSVKCCSRSSISMYTRGEVKQIATCLAIHLITNHRVCVSAIDVCDSGLACGRITVSF